MDQMDLEIDNYSISDLEKFFRLKSKYTSADVEQRGYEIREQLLSSGHINKKFKRDLISFLNEAVERIIHNKFPIKKENLPTTIAKNVILDTSNVPKSSELPTSRMQNIIERPMTNYLNVQTSEYYQGTINPLNTRTINKFITVDTRFRDRYYATSSSDFMITLPMRLNKVVSMQMTAIELPKNFYSICSEYCNNYFTMQIFQDRNGVKYEFVRTIVVPDGNYTAERLVKQINDILCPGPDPATEDAFSCLEFILTSDGVNGFDSGNGRIVVQPKYVPPDYAYQIVEIVLNFATDMNGNNDIIHVSQKLGWILGFVNVVYCGSNFYTSEKAIEPNPIKYIYLAVDDFNKSVNESFITAFEKNGLKPNILARISGSGKGYENTIINHEYTIISEPRKYFGPVDIQRLQIRLFDDYGRILNMNYSDYSFCLNIKILYDL
jgi:hypothetical protein